MIEAIRRVALVAGWEDDLKDPAHRTAVWRETNLGNLLPEEDHVAAVKCFLVESIRELREELTVFKNEHSDLPREGS